MIIKNSDYNLNYISNSYNCKKTDKKDAVQTSKNTDSAFSVDLNKATKSAKVDTIQLSNHKVRSGSTLPEIKNKIISEINADKDSEYLANLKAQINSNQYAVNPLQIAKVMLLGSKE